MKAAGGGGGGSKRGWRSLGIGVICLVILSMLVPLVFLLGLHNNFHSYSYSTTVYVNEDPTSTPVHDKLDFRNENQSQDDKSDHLDKLLNRLSPPISKDVIEDVIKKEFKKAGKKDATQVSTEQKRDPPVLPKDAPKSPSDAKKKSNDIVEATEHVKGSSSDETEMSCQLEFGSYCVWCQEHKEEMKDSTVKVMKDQLFVARAYFPSIAKLPGQEKLSRDMKQNIQEFERILSESTTDADLPPHIEKKLQKMEGVIKKAKSFPVECSYVDRKLRQILDLTEDEAHFHRKQSAFLYQLAVQTIPKSLHCLSMRLTVEYFRSHSLDMDLLPTEKYANPELHHYVILSKNVLASSVVINSTVMHSAESQNQVFHVLTDGQNYYAMKFWFFMNSYKEATVHVINVEDLNLDYHGKAFPLRLSLSEEFRVLLRNVNKPPSSQMNAEYISLFGHTHYFLPEIFQTLKKVVVLDDDIVVQRDLSPLWNLQMEGKVNGAVQYCDVRLNQLRSYLGRNDHDRSSCSWLSGLNVVDLVSWRKLNLTDTYLRLLQEQSTKDASLKVGVFPASLLTFQDLVYALDSSWVLSGLGHDYGIDAHSIEKAAVLHYNGNMKPWLELGVRRYKGRWKKYLKRIDRFMAECNVNP
ncbi:hypothetical protein IFM89_013518 [Coptis chinensis]|uniref:Hexosyltransferase n=1 Tax=Coptis chinensis TaxID=261450 RepID=A0A835H5S4_9MAGN|nr:hypothetical protein IFM89_013518 [Coptis chinensis]